MRNSASRTVIRGSSSTEKDWVIPLADERAMRKTCVAMRVKRSAKWRMLIAHDGFSTRDAACYVARLMFRIVQITHSQHGRRIAVVEEPSLRLLKEVKSVYDLAIAAIESSQRLATAIESQLSSESIGYEEIYSGRSPWKLLPAFDHPREVSRCLVTGTGLTHRASAESRASMHTGTAVVTDSMRMYQAGVEGGRPQPGNIGAQPEWFYKGHGDVLRAHGESLEVPRFGLDGGDEAEIAGCYVIGPDGTPFRVGLAQGNEFSDHVGEARNYLYLAESKLRTCSLGPELLVSSEPEFFSGEIRGRTIIERSGKAIWQGGLASGEQWMCHSLANLEHHHFKNAFHRTPGDAHVHFLGADAFSFRDKIKLETGDEMVVSFERFGRALRNPIRIDAAPEQVTTVKSL
jgi:hypothetical protein